MVLIRKENGCNMLGDKKIFSGGNLVLYPVQVFKDAFYCKKYFYAVLLALTGEQVN